MVVTMGEQGALLHTKDQSHHIAAFDAGPVVETTGAGDAFNGGLATGLGAKVLTRSKLSETGLRNRSHLGDPPGHSVLHAVT